MEDSDAGVRDRLGRVRERIAGAARRSGRDPDSVRIVAVTKGVAPDRIRAAVEADHRRFGENRVQEAREKIPLLPPDLEWHMVGSLQRNEARLAADLFRWIHSVDRTALAEALSAAAGGEPLPVLVQVNTGREPQKGGVAPEGLAGLLREIAALPGIRVEGLMAIPPLTADPEASRPHFRALRALAEEVARLAIQGVSLRDLSMGMSADYEVAVEEGATLVRIGTAIFGPRPGDGGGEGGV
ncbi:MAG: YggS family pyridoxal phosphate-dependent enzyme [Acidobacteria bacterium]|nr:YggS family pyridoxal phosphate-dependent enzyme [Acidobacteriota bacterium]